MFHRILLFVACLVFMMQQNCHVGLASSVNAETHRTEEETFSTYDLKQVQDLAKSDKRMVLTWFVCPKLRLEQADIQALIQNSFKISKAEGRWTIGDLEVIKGKEYIANGQMLLVESAKAQDGAIDFTYQWADDNRNGQTVVLRMKNIIVKDIHDPLSQYLKTIIENPDGPKHVHRHVVVPQTVIVQSAPPKQTPVIVQAPPPYYGLYPPPYYYGPEYIVRFGMPHHHYHHHHR